MILYESTGSYRNLSDMQLCNAPLCSHLRQVTCRQDGHSPCGGHSSARAACPRGGGLPAGTCNARSN